MSVLIGIALKSLLIGGLTLGLLFLMRKRSAAERSWVAHVGLLSLVVMAFAPLVLPSLDVEAPAVLGRAQTPAVALPAAVETDAAPVASVAAPVAREKPLPRIAQAAPAGPRSASLSIDPVAALTAAYAVPAAILLFVTLLALARLVALQARAEVVVDGRWLSALARAQRRMGFKHGTALLTSNELASPISWGLIRPVILLNSRAVEATRDAEAIIAHELAHVARLDWIKLLLARVATALFWFNPLVWLLAREAHQLREETADDTVLAADIADTDYAELLVGVARHECPGLLLGAHGVAPSKSSLARRVARVLDVKLARGPAARGFALTVVVGGLVIIAPLAALTLTPAAPQPTMPSPSSRPVASEPQAPASSAAEAVQADLPHIIAQGVSTSVSTAMAAVAPAATKVRAVAPDAPIVAKVTVEPSGEMTTVTVDPDDPVEPDAWRKTSRRDRAIAIATANGASVVAVSPEYIAAIRSSVPTLAQVGLTKISGLRALGVTPEFARGLASAGFPSISAGELMAARSVGLSADYVSAMRAAGVQVGSPGTELEFAL